MVLLPSHQFLANVRILRYECLILCWWLRWWNWLVWPTTCAAGSVCTYDNVWYSQCLPSSNPGESLPPITEIQSTSKKCSLEIHSQHEELGTTNAPSSNIDLDHCHKAGYYCNNISNENLNFWCSDKHIIGEGSVGWAACIMCARRDLCWQLSQPAWTLQASTSA